MNPIRLRDPNGNTVGYICGVCGKFPSADLLVPIWEPDVEPKRWSSDWNEMALEFTERCCICPWCRERPVDDRGSTCSECAGAADAESKRSILRLKRESGYAVGRTATSLRAAKDRKAALQLRRWMSEWSEMTECASWIGGLESRLWSGGELSASERRQFRGLVRKAGGAWVVRREGNRYLSLFLPLTEWLDSEELRELTSATDGAKVTR